MRRVLCAVIACLLSAQPLFAAGPLAAPGGPAGPAGESPEARKAQLKRLVEILRGLSDEDYLRGRSEIPGPEARDPRLASRAGALKAAYSGLAALEYERASVSAGKGKRKEYQGSYERVIRDGAAPGAATDEAGLPLALVWIGASVLRYWLSHATTSAGRELGPRAEPDPAVERLEGELASGERSAAERSETHYRLGSTYEKLASEQPAPEDEKAARKKLKIKQLVALLLSFSNEEYLKVWEQTHGSAAPASRSEALQSAYVTLAGLEYRQAAREAGDAGDRYAGAYRKLLDEKPKAVAVHPETLEESGLAIDLVKWLGNAALNYWLYGGPTLVGREIAPDTEVGRLSSAAQSLEERAELAETSKERTEARAELAAAYEKLAAAAAEPEPESQKSARQKARLVELAGLLEGVSEDDYKEALSELPEKAAARAELASRGGLLKSAYTTLAALEYRDAARREPGSYEADYERVSRDSGGLAVDPETMQQAGWGTKLLGLATLGGIGYLIYENQRLQRRGRAVPPPPPSPPPPAPERPPLECPPGAELRGDRCVALEVSCPAGTKPIDGRCVAQEVSCPEGTRPQGGRCVAVEIACPEGTKLDGGRCVATEISCPIGTKESGGSCLAPISCPEGTRPVDGRCVAQTIDVNCPPGTHREGSLCIGSVLCPPGTRKVPGATCLAIGCPPPRWHCEAQVSCPPGTSRVGAHCQAEVTCPPGTRKENGACLGEIRCPPSTQLSDGACLASINCPPGMKLTGGRCEMPPPPPPPPAPPPPPPPPVRPGPGGPRPCGNGPRTGTLPPCRPPSRPPRRCGHGVCVSRVAGAYSALDEIEGQLASAELKASDSAARHHRMGKLYEELAGSQAGAERPAPPQPKEPAKPAPPKAKREPKPAPPPEPKAVEPEEAEEDTPFKSGIREMEDMGESMRRKIDRKRGKSD